MAIAIGPTAVATVQTPWGWAGLAATDRGLLACAWPYLESDQAQQALQGQLSHLARRAASGLQAGAETLVCEQYHSEQDLAHWAAAALLAFFWGSLREIEKIPVDERFFSNWQRRVYQSVRAIEPGTALSYGEVAASCGQRSAARAVGQAMAANPLPLFIPCHRVVRGGCPRQLGNYGCGGTAMKERLLIHEQAWP